MRVLQVIDRLNIGGAEKVTLNITRLLLDKNIEVGVLLFNSGYPLEKELDTRAQLFTLNRKNKFSLSKLYHAHKICTGYDIVHAHMRQVYAYVRLAQLVFGGKYKLILHDHFGNIEIDKEVSFRLKSVFKPKYYIGVSHTLVNWAKEYVKLPGNNVYLLENTISVRDNVQFESKENLQKVFIVSNIRETKNIEFAVQLFNSLRCEATIYGNKTSDEYFNKVQSLIKDNSKVKIVQGLSNLSSEYNNYSLAIHCGISETGPLVLLEYMAYGIPFLAYNTGEVANKIATEFPLLFIDTFDIDKWKERIKLIMQDKDLSERLKQAFYKYFSPDNYIDKCLTIYQDINY